MSASRFQLPTIFVLFGITGDLVQKKILRSLYSLYLKGLLPQKFQVIGFARRPYDDDTLRHYLLEVMQTQNLAQPERYNQFLTSFYYIQGDFDTEQAYTQLAERLGRVDQHWQICSNKLFYLAVPPRNYREILNNIHTSGLTIPCSAEEGWTRVILEKPFGSDLQEAEELDRLLASLFKEEQIYRVDHYLAKETVRNILAFRFSNSVLQPAWNSEQIEKIEIKLLEKATVSTRGEFYDQIGALRDVGQNHILQMLALFTMDKPSSFSAHDIRSKRAEALGAVKIFAENEVEQYTTRGQYDGYRLEDKVNPDSTTETYFRIQTQMNNQAFKGVPIYLESGKGFAQDLTEIIITFRHLEPCICPDGKHYQNILRYTIQPEEKFSISLLVKKPGYSYALIEKKFEFDYGTLYAENEFIEAYEQLLQDIIKGDQTLFVSTQEIFHQWKFVEPIIKAWKRAEQREILQYLKNSEQVIS